jgi:hypothetical protein
MEPTSLEGRMDVIEKGSRDYQTPVLSHFSRLEHQIRIGDEDTRRLMMVLHDQTTAKVAVLAERLGELSKQVGAVAREMRAGRTQRKPPPKR